jgi:pimeloyl-ACP methyl ester carboxylesterase
VPRASVRRGPLAAGPPLLLLNGIGAGLWIWEPRRAGLAMETVAFDAPGSGETSASVLPIPMPMPMTAVIVGGS